MSGKTTAKPKTKFKNELIEVLRDDKDALEIAINKPMPRCFNAIMDLVADTKANDESLKLADGFARAILIHIPKKIEKMSADGKPKMIAYRMQKGRLLKLGILLERRGLKPKALDRIG